MNVRDVVVAVTLAAGLMALVASPVAAAQETSGPAPSEQAEPSTEAEVDGLELIREQQLELKAALDAGETEGLSVREVNRIRKEQVGVFALIDGKATLADMSINQKVELENALERINAYVKGGRAGRDEQDVCWRERMSGTSRMVTRCGTEKERDLAREGAREFLGKPRVCIPPGCGN